MLQNTSKVHELLQKWHLDDLLQGCPTSDLLIFNMHLYK